ncbi:hypothetical protein NZL82_15420 [Sphingomonas sanguinis]|uniref:hypothetical protein n=1 Tax=Sphingomonas sp. LC-1 TaxID=3110957 RepID=UPI0021BA7641|nr:hypothetical protein [Sphingomonas sp. LC-1]MCT8003265.1 hypothetical protein [Sphingomonas sp. LC-1]
MTADIHFLSLAADLPKTVSPSLAGGVVLPPVAGDFVDHRASDRDADGARRGGEVIGIHNHSTNETEGRDHV